MSSGEHEISGRLIALAEDRRPVGADVRRQVLAALFRLLVQRREPNAESLQHGLRLTTERINRALGARGSFLLLLDASVKEAEVVAAALAEPRDRGARERRETRAQGLIGARLRAVQLGLLPEVHAPLRQAELSEEQVPLALKHSLRGECAPLLVVPVSVSQRLEGLLVLLGRTSGRAYSEPELEFAEEVARHLVRGLQRSLGLGAPLSEDEKGQCVAVLADVSWWEPAEDFEPDLDLLEELGERLLGHNSILPLERRGRGLKVALGNPLDAQAIDAFELASGLEVRERLASTPARVRSYLRRAFPNLADEAEEGPNLQGDLVAQLAQGLGEYEDTDPFQYTFTETIDERSSPIVRLASKIIEDAYFRGASDVHVEASEHAVVVRHRVDGACRERVQLPAAAARPLVARLKIMSDLDVAEHRLPQDGRIDYRRYNRELPIDLRVSILPMLHGEWVCLRILEKKRSALPLDELGFSSYNLDRYRQALRTPYGLILHCGPTGAGKSMTLYAALNELNDPRLKIVTAEDPIEYVLRGIGQLQIKRSIGLDFSKALRSFLRHDPDVILVGEIRDSETAQIAVDASLTGHLLLSTLHTNDASSSIARLVKLGIEPFLVANTLVGICAQRLVRRLCHCRELVAPSAQERAYMKRAQDEGSVNELGKAVGCEHCNHLGYRGRTGVHELMLMGGRLRQQISEEATAEVLKRTARDLGMRTLFEDCLEKVKAQTTTLEETFRVSQPDEQL